MRSNILAALVVIAAACGPSMVTGSPIPHSGLSTVVAVNDKDWAIEADSIHHKRAPADGGNANSGNTGSANAGNIVNSGNTISNGPGANTAHNGGNTVSGDATGGRGSNGGRGGSASSGSSGSARGGSVVNNGGSVSNTGTTTNPSNTAGNGGYSGSGNARGGNAGRTRTKRHGVVVPLPDTELPPALSEDPNDLLPHPLVPYIPLLTVPAAILSEPDVGGQDGTATVGVPGETNGTTVYNSDGTGQVSSETDHSGDGVSQSGDSSVAV